METQYDKEPFSPGALFTWNDLIALTLIQTQPTTLKFGVHWKEKGNIKAF